MNDITIAPQVRQHFLEHQRVAARHAMPAYMAQTARLDVENVMFDQLVYQLSAYVLTEKIVDDIYTVTVDVPRSWWQHFKRDCLPQWWKNKWPVQYETVIRKVRFIKYNTYPDATIALPEERFGKPVIWETVTPLWLEQEH